MLFSSATFLFAFLPLVWAGFHGIRILGSPGLARYFLIAASLFFYGWWNPVYIGLILFSMVANYLLGLWLANPGAGRGHRPWVAAGGVVFNLALLGYFKYAGFVVNAFTSLVLHDPVMLDIVLPLAISFFTFQQVAFLVDVYRNSDIMRQTSFDRYLCFVLFFPQLIAGPIVHHKALVPQLEDKPLNSVTQHQVVLGLAIFFLGLFKKVVLADPIGDISEPLFERHAQGWDLPPVNAWLAILAFTLRLYFDFSAYSDMAFGIGLMFGVILPVNFFSPYKATNLNETWLRWNMTLGHFFGSYIFKPLGGRKRGPWLASRNVLILMLASGVWHGAGWNYLIWGLMQGLAMVWLLFWSDILDRLRLGRIKQWWWYRQFFCCAVTFLFWVISLVAFKVARVDDIFRFYSAMFDVRWHDLSQWFLVCREQLVTLVANFAEGGSLAVSAVLETSLWVVAGLLMVFLAPNVLQFFGVTSHGRIGHTPLSLRKGIIVGVAAAVAIVKVISSTSNEFIYFQF